MSVYIAVYTHEHFKSVLYMYVAVNVLTCVAHWEESKYMEYVREIRHIIHDLWLLCL